MGLLDPLEGHNRGSFCAFVDSELGIIKTFFTPEGMQPWTEEECKTFEAGVVHVIMKHIE